MAKTAQEYVGTALGKFVAAADKMLNGELSGEVQAREAIGAQFQRLVTQSTQNERYANAILHSALLAYANEVAREAEAEAALARGEQPKRRGRRAATSGVESSAS